MRFPNDVLIRVRSGTGTVRPDGSFTDIIETISRTPRQRKGWRAVAYKGKLYQLHGNIRTDYFICTNNPSGIA